MIIFERIHMVISVRYTYNKALHFLGNSDGEDPHGGLENLSIAPMLDVHLTTVARVPRKLADCT